MDPIIFISLYPRHLNARHLSWHGASNWCRQPQSVMKTTRNILTALIAAVVPGAALLAFSNRVSADLAFASITVMGLFAFAIYDFTRNTASLKVRATVIRPPLRSINSPLSASVRKAA